MGLSRVIIRFKFGRLAPKLIPTYNPAHPPYMSPGDGRGPFPSLDSEARGEACTGLFLGGGGCWIGLLRTSSQGWGPAFDSANLSGRGVSRDRFCEYFWQAILGNSKLDLFLAQHILFVDSLNFFGILHFLPVKSVAAAASHRSQTFLFTGEK